MSHALGGRPKVIGTLNRFFQFDAAHQYRGETEASTPRLAKLLVPGRNWPARRQLRSAAARSGFLSAQLRPMIGMTTIEQATFSEQPSDSFSIALRTSNSVLPVPSRLVNADCSAGGNDEPTAASGGIVAEVHPLNVSPLAVMNGV